MLIMFAARPGRWGGCCYATALRDEFHESQTCDTEINCDHTDVLHRLGNSANSNV